MALDTEGSWRSGTTTEPPVRTVPTRRVRSRLARGPAVTPEPSTSMTHHSSAGSPPSTSRTATGASNRVASTAPSTGPTSPETRRVPSPAGVASNAPDPGRATAVGVVPSTMGPSRTLRWGSSAPAATTAAASMVGRAGPGMTARAISSTTTASSSIPKPWPPCSSATWMPSQPWAASSSQNGGMVSVSASSRARGTSGGQRARASGARCGAAPRDPPLCRWACSNSPVCRDRAAGAVRTSR